MRFKWKKLWIVGVILTALLIAVIVVLGINRRRVNFTKTQPPGISYQRPLEQRLGNMSWAYTTQKNVMLQQQAILNIQGSYIRLPLVISDSKITSKNGYEFKEEDYAVKLALSYGLTPIITFHTKDHNGKYMSPKDASVRVIKKIIHSTIKRYANKGIVWEAWNEPNGMFWTSDSTDWHHYKQWGKIDIFIANQVHKYDHSGIYIAGNLAGTPTDKENVVLVKRLKKMGALKFASAISFHPYISKQKDNGRPEQLLSSDTNVLLKTEGIHLPIVTTEFGYPISETIHPWQGVWSESEQANYMARSIFIFDMLKQPIISLYNAAIDDSYGFYDLKTNAPRQVQLLISSLMGNLKGYKFIKRLKYPDKDVYFLLYGNKAKRKIVFWKAHGTKEVTIEVLEKKFQLTVNETPQIFTR